MNQQINLFADAVQTSKEDIRSEKQQNRKVAYDVGVKIGGSRKDEAALRKAFLENHTVNSLEELEGLSPLLASSLVKKEELFSGFSLEAEKELGTEPVVARVKQLVIQRIDKEPAVDSPEERKSYMLACENIQSILRSITTLDEFLSTYYEIRKRIHYENTDCSYIINKIKEAERAINRVDEGFAEWMEAKDTFDHYSNLLAKIKEAKKLPLRCLGKKFVNFFMNAKSGNNTINTVKKSVTSWEDLLKKKSKKSTSKKSTKLWERTFAERPDRVGGIASSVRKPEDLQRNHGFRSIEFGHYVDDSKAEEHILRSSEGFYDLCDALDLDHYYAVSLNANLSVSFGSRGRGKALGHFDANAKVINLTRDKGCNGVLAHEFFHALDNYLFDYSHSHKNGKIGFATELSGLGILNPTIKDCIQNLMAAIKSGHSKEYIPNKNKEGDSWRISTGLTSVYERFNGDLFLVMETFKKQLDQSLERRLSMVHYLNSNSEKDKEKILKRNKRELNKYAQAVAWLHQKRTGERVDSIPCPSDKSEFFTNAVTLDRGKIKYYATDVELAARAFEAFIEDTLKSMNRKNDYLVFHTFHSLAYPNGIQRKEINTAFKAFFQALKKIELL